LNFKSENREPPPEIPKTEPPFKTRATQWLVKAGWRPVLPIAIRMELEATIGGRIGLFLATMEAAYWTYRAYPYIHSYFDPPKTLEDLRQNVKPGYDEHHIVEQWSKDDGIPEEAIVRPTTSFPYPSSNTGGSTVGWTNQTQNTKTTKVMRFHREST
jgi:hypothetical protein